MKKQGRWLWFNRRTEVRSSDTAYWFTAGAPRKPCFVPSSLLHGAHRIPDRSRATRRGDIFLGFWNQKPPTGLHSHLQVLVGSMLPGSPVQESARAMDFPRSDASQFFEKVTFFGLTPDFAHVLRASRLQYNQLDWGQWSRFGPTVRLETSLHRSHGNTPTKSRNRLFLKLQFPFPLSAQVIIWRV